LKVVYNPL